jgi:hypothetical protein
MGDSNISHSDGVQPVSSVRANCDELVNSAQNGVEHIELTQSVRNGTPGADGLQEKARDGSAGPRKADEYQVDFS